ASERGPDASATSCPPPKRPSTRGRRRHRDTSHPCWPDPDWRSGGWGGWGPLTATGHPRGGSWRQRSGSSGGGALLETQGTLWPGKRGAVDLIVPVSGCWAEGVGIRGTARGGEGAPNPGLGWWVEAADQRRAWAPAVVPGLHLP